MRIHFKLHTYIYVGGINWRCNQIGISFILWLHKNRKNFATENSVQKKECICRSRFCRKIGWLHKPRFCSCDFVAATLFGNDRPIIFLRHNFAIFSDHRGNPCTLKIFENFILYQSKARFTLIPEI